MNVFSNMKSNWNAKISSYQALDSKDKNCLLYTSILRIWASEKVCWLLL